MYCFVQYATYSTYMYYMYHSCLKLVLILLTMKESEPTVLQEFIKFAVRFPFLV